MRKQKMPRCSRNDRQSAASAGRLTLRKVSGGKFSRCRGSKMFTSPARPKGHAMKPQILTLGLLIGAGLPRRAGPRGDRVCAERTTIVERLAAEYGETRQAIGLASASQVVEIFASDETGSWTITVTRPDGTDLPDRGGPAFRGARRRADAGGAWRPGLSPNRPCFGRPAAAWRRSAARAGSAHQPVPDQLQRQHEQQAEDQP